MKQIYKFSASWCQPCKTLTARLKQKDITLPEYDIDNPDNKALMERYNVRQVPTVVVDDDGLIQYFVGAVTTSELLEAIK